MEKVRKLAGAPLIPVRERNFKEKPCKNCGEYFQPTLPYQKYCCDECRKAGYKKMRKEKDKRSSKRKHDAIVAYNMKHHFCPICGQPLESRVQHVHFDCMVKKWRDGDRSKQTKRYFYNRGYNQEDINDLAYGTEGAEQ